MPRKSQKSSLKKPSKRRPPKTPDPIISLSEYDSSEIVNLIDNISMPECATCYGLENEQVEEFIEGTKGETRSTTVHLFPLPPCTCKNRLVLGPLPHPIELYYEKITKSKDTGDSSCESNEKIHYKEISSIKDAVSSLHLNELRLKQFNFTIMCKTCMEKMVKSSSDVIQLEYKDPNQPNPKFTVESKCPHCFSKFSQRNMHKLLSSDSELEWKSSLRCTIILCTVMNHIHSRIKNQQNEKPTKSIHNNGTNNEAATCKENNNKTAYPIFDSEIKPNSPISQSTQNPQEVLNDIMEKGAISGQKHDDSKLSRGLMKKKISLTPLPTENIKSGSTMMRNEKGKNLQCKRTLMVRKVAQKRKIEEEDRLLAKRLQAEYDEALKRQNTKKKVNSVTKRRSSSRVKIYSETDSSSNTSIASQSVKEKPKTPTINRVKRSCPSKTDNILTKKISSNRMRELETIPVNNENDEQHTSVINRVPAVTTAEDPTLQSYNTNVHQTQPSISSLLQHYGLSSINPSGPHYGSLANSQMINPLMFPPRGLHRNIFLNNIPRLPGIGLYGYPHPYGHMPQIPAPFMAMRSPIIDNSSSFARNIIPSQHNAQRPVTTVTADSSDNDEKGENNTSTSTLHQHQSQSEVQSNSSLGIRSNISRTEHILASLEGMGIPRALAIEKIRENFQCRG